jgi:hypothetical protein
MKSGRRQLINLKILCKIIFISQQLQTRERENTEVIFEKCNADEFRTYVIRSVLLLR